tara:strand:- start:521 stop:646 length:126 start_codon:yes stop_codon:yes gene_type:complete
MFLASSFLGTVWWSILMFLAGAFLGAPIWSWIKGYLPWNKR